MKVTLQIDNAVAAELVREPARQGRTTSDLVEIALRSLLASQNKPAELPPLPVFHGGELLVYVADRDALYDTMEGR